MRRIPAWLGVVAYFLLAEPIYLVFGSFGDNVPSVIAWTLHLLLAITFLVARGREEGGGILMIFLGVGFVVVFVGQILDLPYEVRAAIWAAVASLFTFIAFDRNPHWGARRAARRERAASVGTRS